MLHEISYPSFNERDNVQGWIYIPPCQPKGIIQLVHGFGEHSRRYLPMITYFMDQEYIVAADDHVGHGKTAIVNNETWGNWGDKGFHTMMEDEYSLMKIVKDMYPDLPYLMFGHSMGSFIARDFATKYGEELDAVALCGTSGEFPNLNENIKMLEELVDNGLGDDSDPSIGARLLGWMFERCEEGAKIGNEWICHDPEVQRDHAEDPFDAFTKPTSNRAFLYFCQMIEYITGKEWAEKVPVELPFLNISGDEDPVGQYGEGVYQVTNWLKSTGHDVYTEVFSGYRHEIHNYEDLKITVFEKIVDFFDIAIGEYDDLFENI